MKDELLYFTLHTTKISDRLLGLLGILQTCTIFEHTTTDHLPNSRKTPHLGEDLSKQMLCSRDLSQYAQPVGPCKAENSKMFKVSFIDLDAICSHYSF